jgi:hypothetical protein
LGDPVTPAAAIAMLDRQIAQHGETVTLTRIGTPDVTLDVQAFVRRAVVDPLVPGGDPAQYGTVVVLSPTGLTTFVPPLRLDQITVGGRDALIEEVETVRMADEVVRYNLRIKG